MRLRLPSWTNRVRVPLEGKKEAVTPMKTWRMWGVVGMMVVAGAAWAEDVTVTTYYPSPRGVYDDLQFRKAEDYDNTIYKVDPNDQTKLDKLDVNTQNNLGNLTITGSLWVKGTPIGGVTYVALTIDGPTTLNRTAVIENHASGVAFAAADAPLYVQAIAATNKALHVRFGKTLLDDATEIASSVSGAQVLKVTGTGAANPGLLVTNGETKLEQKTTVGLAGNTNLVLDVNGKSNLKDLTTVGTAANASTVVLDVMGQTALKEKTTIGTAANANTTVLDVLGKAEFHKDVTLDEKLILNGSPTSLEATNDVIIHGKLTVGRGAEITGNTKVIGGLEVTGDAKFKSVTAEDFISVITPSAARLDTSIQTVGSIDATLDVIAHRDVKGKRFVDLDAAAYLVDPDQDSKLHKLTLDELVGNLTINGNLKVTGTSDFRGAIGNDGGASPLVVSSTINLVQGRDLTATDGSSTSYVGGGGGNLGVGTMSGGAKAGAECTGAGVCHLQAIGLVNTLDADSSGGFNVLSKAGNAIFNGGGISIQTGSTLTIDTGGMLDVTNATLTAGSGTATTGSTVLINDTGRPQWATLPAAAAPSTDTCVKQIWVSASACVAPSVSAGQVTPTVWVCYSTITCNVP
ncbi:MAG: hypothetical protein HY352_05875 [Candidatus Omnitrophica bacterium]|nr:hypothetical protein [Candidatus Omnitrophota bacterium]